MNRPNRSQAGSLTFPPSPSGGRAECEAERGASQHAAQYCGRQTCPVPSSLRFRARYSGRQDPAKRDRGDRSARYSGRGRTGAQLGIASDDSSVPCLGRDTERCGAKERFARLEFGLVTPYFAARSIRSYTLASANRIARRRLQSTPA